MGEKATKYDSITVVKAAVCSFFVKLSKLSGGGGQLLAPWRGIFAHNRISSSKFGLNHSAKSNLGADGFFDCLYLGLKKRLTTRLTPRIIRLSGVKFNETMDVTKVYRFFKIAE